MSDNTIEIQCVRCKEVWSEDLDRLDKKIQTTYKGLAPRKQYRVECPRCDTNNIVTVEFEEGDDG